MIGLNPDGTVKIQDLEGTVQNVSPKTLNTYRKVDTPEERLLKNKSQLDKSQEEFLPNSSTNPTGNPSTESKEFEPAKKQANRFYISTITESEEYNDPSQSAPHIQRARKFLNDAKTFRNRKKISVILVTPNQEKQYGLEGISQLSYPNGTNLTDIDNGLVLSVFVEDDKGKLYFINENGRRLSEVGQPIDVNTVVFQTMPTTSTIDSSNEPRYRANEKELLEGNAKAWRQKREELFAYNGAPKAYKFNISRGIPFESSTENYHVGQSLIEERKIPTTEGLIQISKEGALTHNGDLLKIPNGRPVLVYGDTFQPLLNNKLGKEKATNIYHIINTLVKELVGKNEKGEKLELNSKLISYLQNVLYYTNKKDVKSGNKFMIDSSNMSIILGDTAYSFNEFSDKKDAIIDQLTNIYHNINDRTLTKNFNNSFTEFVYDESTNSIKEGKEYTNYQTYLLSKEGRAVDNTPLVTSVIPASTSVPYSYKTKYATLLDYELPVISAPLKPKTTKTEKLVVQKETPTEKVEPTKLGEYKLDGVTENTFKAASGNIPFIASIDEEGNINVEANVPEEVLEKSGKDASFITKVITANLVKLQKESTSKVETSVEEKKEEAPKTSGFNPKNLGKPKDEYRRVGEDTEEKITNTEIELFKEWAKANVPNMPYEVLDNIIKINETEEAWGVFEDGVAKFYKGAIKGTEYHEVFEGIFKSFLSPEQRTALLNEFKSQQGEFIDRQTGKRIEFSKATDLQAKERIADDFADFRLGKIKAKSLGQSIRDFFRNIIEFFKSFIIKPSLKKQLFKAIDTGKFKEYTITPKPSRETQFRLLKEIDENQKEELRNSKPILSTTFLSAKELVNLENPVKARNAQKKLMDEFSDIQKILNCLWTTI